MLKKNAVLYGHSNLREKKNYPNSNPIFFKDLDFCKIFIQILLLNNIYDLTSPHEDLTQGKSGLENASFTTNRKTYGYEIFS